MTSFDPSGFRHKGRHLRTRGCSAASYSHPFFPAHCLHLVREPGLGNSLLVPQCFEGAGKSPLNIPGNYYDSLFAKRSRCVAGKRFLSPVSGMFVVLAVGLLMRTCTQTSIAPVVAMYFLGAATFPLFTKEAPAPVSVREKFAEKLNSFELRQLKQRVALRCHLQPLDLDEPLATCGGGYNWQARGEMQKLFSLRTQSQRSIVMLAEFPE